MRTQPWNLHNRIGLSFINNEWSMNERAGKNAMNTRQLQQNTHIDKYGGFRLARDTQHELAEQEGQPLDRSLGRGSQSKFRFVLR
ncbi:hypothetical protein EBZ80_08580 [bacterium]|nr:hypothetical protein [bacterium]